MGKKRDTSAGRPVTVESIARRAGVSIASVSTVLNDRHVERRIAAGTVEKIRRTAAELGYLPNIGARRLRRGEQVRNSLVLALITSFEAPIPLVKHFIFALRQAVWKSGLPQAGSAVSVMLEMYTAGRLAEMPGLLTGDHFNAAIILNTTPADDAFLAAQRLPYPAVLVNRRVPGYSSVVESADCGARPAEIFARQQRRRLAVLHGSPLTQITRVRVEAFAAAARQCTGRAATPIVATTLSETAGYEALKLFLREEESIDALYSVSDALALGAYRALKEARLAIPRDVAVVGVGDYEIAPFYDPPLSCVGPLHQELADTAGRLLLAQLRGGRGVVETASTPARETLRESSGHPPA